MGVLTRKFVFSAGLLVAAAGMGGEVYTSHQAGTTLAEDYGRAATCAAKTAQKQPCTEAEQTSVAKKNANEEIRTYSHGVVTTGLVLTVWGAL